MTRKTLMLVTGILFLLIVASISIMIESNGVNPEVYFLFTLILAISTGVFVPLFIQLLLAINKQKFSENGDA